MIQIEGHWETIDSLYDVSKIVREYYNRELADELDMLIAENEVSTSEVERLEELEDIIEEIKMLVL